MEAEASGILGSLLGQLGIFGGILALLIVLVYMWMRESRAVRQDTETAIARKAKDLERKNAELAAKDAELGNLKKALQESEDRERATYNALMECRYPELKHGGASEDH